AVERDDLELSEADDVVFEADVVKTFFGCWEAPDDVPPFPLHAVPPGGEQRQVKALEAHGLLERRHEAGHGGVDPHADDGLPPAQHDASIVIPFELDVMVDCDLVIPDTHTIHPSLLQNATIAAVGGWWLHPLRMPWFRRCFQEDAAFPRAAESVR